MYRDQQFGYCSWINNQIKLKAFKVDGFVLENLLKNGKSVNALELGQ